MFCPTCGAQPRATPRQAMPPSAVSPRKKRSVGKTIGVVIAVGVLLLIVLVIIAAAAGGGSSTKGGSNGSGSGSSPADTSNTPSTVAQSLVEKSGSGQWASLTFTAPGIETITYNYDCSSFGQSGNFIVSVYGPGNAMTTDGINELKTSGSGTTSIHDVSGDGTYLQVNSECNWQVSASA